MKKKKNLSWWCDRAWIKFGLVISIVMLGFLLAYWNVWSLEMKIVASIAMLIPLHVIEEWVFPGGFNYQYNVTLYRSPTPDHYPMCRLSDMFTNLVTTFLYIGLLIYSICDGFTVAPGILMGTVAFCTLEFTLHTVFGTVMYFRFKDKGKSTIYGPGSITAYFGFLPLGILSIYALWGVNLTWVDWLWAIGILAFIAIICILIPESIIKNRCSDKYPFASNGYFDRFLDK